MGGREIFATSRLRLCALTPEDYGALCPILQDAETMAAYEHAFSDDEVRAWLGRQLRRYREDGIGLWAVRRRSDGLLVGQCGLTLQDIGRSRPVTEIGYLFRRDCWHRGYATEAAQGCRAYAFGQLGLPEVWSIVRDTNLASRRVAERNGMVRVGRLLKHYWGVSMPHDLFRVSAPKPRPCP